MKMKYRTVLLILKTL